MKPKTTQLTPRNAALAAIAAARVFYRDPEKRKCSALVNSVVATAGSRAAVAFWDRQEPHLERLYILAFQMEFERLRRPVL